jgi:hypothetical protein
MTEAAPSTVLLQVFPCRTFISSCYAARWRLSMTKSRFVCGSIVVTAIFAGGVLVGQTMVTASAPPKLTLGANFPNLQAAQKAIIEAWNAATKTQEAYPNNLQVRNDINEVGRYLNQANDGLEQAAKDEGGH